MFVLNTPLGLKVKCNFYIEMMKHTHALWKLTDNSIPFDHTRVVSVEHQQWLLPLQHIHTQMIPLNLHQIAQSVSGLNLIGMNTLSMFSNVLRHHPFCLLLNT